MNKLDDASSPRSALRALATGLVLGAGLLAVPATAPPPVAAVGPLPACRLADIPTVPRDYDSWSTTLVDWLLTVGEDYVPPDLVPVTEAGIAGGGYIREVAIDDLGAMASAAAEAGTPIAVNSPYRSYAEQVASFNGWVDLDGYDDAITYSQRPGHSEHQLGLTIDFMTAGGGSALQGDWATTPSGAWMAENAWKYGWLMSYPKGEGGALFSDATCFHYEPWHYRYLGRELAALVHDSGLTIREYLWTNFTMVDPTTGEPIPTATPTPSATPTPTPTPSATPTPTAVATPTLSAAPSAGTQPVSTWFGVDPPVVLAGLLFIVLASIGFAAWRGISRR
ncbi:MAG TPA: M15 family metallopeptidase [Candidatus Limnocylindria bacterium]|nr:M15 family metallopeptidase [Candidatus Limnocylindria bacterium]